MKLQNLDPKMNKNPPKFEKQLKWVDAIDNVVHEIKLLKARCKDFQWKVMDIELIFAEKNYW